ncbi:hypothetical protein OEZ85_010432 [Tetradesmus obliquus]|uniref:SAM domain-containing protein n=1 Tax=Tetradesmus obliquus TaxID=3088 RepID=A0ABY8TMK2_TETOB|nr:hypothetical protein OEZ85_010432 [Tetradesmus obliquus]
MAELAVAEVMQQCRDRLSPTGAYVVAKYKDKLVEAGFVSVQAIRYATAEELEGAGLSFGAASLLKSAVETYPAAPGAAAPGAAGASTAGAAAAGAGAATAGPAASTNELAVDEVMQQCRDRLSPVGASLVAKYKDKLVEAGFVSVQAIRYATAEELEGAGLSIGAASALKSAVGTTYTGVCVDVTHTGALPSRSANNMGLLRQVRRAAQEDACTQPEDDCEPRQRLLANYDGRPHAD